MVIVIMIVMIIMILIIHIRLHVKVFIIEINTKNTLEFNTFLITEASAFTSILLGNDVAEEEDCGEQSNSKSLHLCSFLVLRMM